MRVPRIIVSAAAALAAAACASEQGSESAADTAAAAAAAPVAAPAAAPGAPAAAGSAADPDQATAGGGIPAGYTGRTDNPSAAITAAKYAATGGQWEITTGPAHIVYRAADTGTGQYTATASFEQLEAPRHPEAYGLFIGGQNLDQPSQRYTYFIVRGTGEYAVKVRDGASARDVVAFRAGEGVPKADASGKATYKLSAHVAADTVHFLVNDKVVAAAPKTAVPTDGIAGLRVNHNLHVRTAPVQISK